MNWLILVALILISPFVAALVYAIYRIERMTREADKAYKQHHERVMKFQKRVEDDLEASRRRY